MARFLNLQHIVVLLLIWISVANASVTWRRVTKPSRSATQDATTVAVPSTTKATVTWRRSTKSRRSTTRKEEPIPIEESEEIETADSKEHASLMEEDTEQESSIRPLVPGSRPGFWFDSSRRKRPSALLRPGARRNSLFPTKSSTKTTISTTIAPVSATNITPSTSVVTPKPNSSSNKAKLYGRNRSTKSPNSFRRRLKTTVSTRTSSTTVAPVSEELDTSAEVPQKLKDIIAKDEREREDDFPVMSKDADENSAEKVRIEPPKSIQTPVLGIRRRPKNGTRLSWKKGGGRFSTRTTPQSTRLSTTSAPIVTPSKIYERSSRRPASFPRIRTRTRANRTTASPKVSWTRSEKYSTPPDIPTTVFDDKKHPEKIRGSSGYLKNRNVHKFNRVKSKPIPEEESEENKDFTETSFPKDDDLSSTPEPYYTKSRTTVEPFYITRDYGQLVTAISEDRSTRGHLASRTTNSPKTSTTINTTMTAYPIADTIIPTQTTFSTIPEEEMYANETLEDAEDTSLYSDEPQYTEVNETSLINNEEEVFENSSLKPLEAEENFEYTELDTTTEAALQRYQSTTSRPSITFPTVSHTINPGTNAYVVWSLGQGGSGWSYEKQGGQVKWSAQNSPAAGDRWSVQGKEEKIDFDQTLWMPTRNTSRFYSERIIPKKTENKVPIRNKNSNSVKYEEPVTYIPNVPYRNETFLKIQTTPETYSFPPLTDKELSQFSSDFTNFTSSFYQNPGLSFSHDRENGVSFNENPVLYQGTSSQFNDSSTPAFYPNLGTEYTRFDGKESPYSANQNTALNVPYMAEIRETYNDVPNFDIRQPENASNVQEYLTETPETSEERITPVIPYKLPEIDYGLGFEYNLPKTTYSPFQTSGIPPYSTGSPENLSGGLLGNVDEGYHGIGQQVADFSGLPPELAKAVVDAKRWTVVGNGGDEGWSLLGDDGQLEWKIDNIDGKWTVTSADELLKMPLQLPDSSTAPQKDKQEEIERPNSEVLTNDRPKIWTLDDDYEKWRVLSAEGGIQSESPNKKWIPNGEYDYDQSEETQDDYYDEGAGEDDDYDGTVDNFTPYSFNENFDDRPLWGENQMIYNNHGDQTSSYPTYGGQIESANTKEDAIAAWKSLLVDQGNWKLSKEDKNQAKPPRPVNSAQYDYSHSGWKVSSRPVSKPQRNFEDIPIPAKLTAENYAKIKRKDTTEYNHYVKPQHQKSNSRSTEQLAENRKKDVAEENKENSNLLKKKDHAKIEALISKLENIQKEAKGRAVVDLSQLLKLIKANRNSTTSLSKIKSNPEAQSQTTRTEDFPAGNKHEKEEYKGFNKQIHSKEQQEDLTESKLSSLIQTLRKQTFSDKNLNDLKNYVDVYAENRFNNEDSGSAYRNDNKNTEKQEKSNAMIEGKRIYHKEAKPIENQQFFAGTPFDSHNSPAFRESEHLNNQRRSDTDVGKLKTYNKEPEPVENHKFFNELAVTSFNKQVHREQEYRSDQRKSDDRFEERRIYTDEREHVRTPNNYSPNFYNAQKHFTNRRTTDDKRLSGRYTNEKNIYATEYERGPKFATKTPTNNENRQNYDYTDEIVSDQRKSDLKLKEQKNHNEETLSEDDYKFVSDNGQRYPKSKPRRKQNRPRTASRTQFKRPSENLSDKDKFSGKRDQRPEELDYPPSNYANSPTDREYEYYRHKHPSLKQKKHHQTSRRKFRPSGKSQQHRLRSGSRSDTKLGSSEEVVFDVREKSQASYEQKRRLDANIYDSSSELPSRKQRRPSRKRSHKHSRQPPIVLSSETEIEDEEDGSKKSRKIIVIDYAGKQKKKSPIDRKDLELIIRNVKNRRSELMENPSNERRHAKIAGL